MVEWSDRVLQETLAWDGKRLPPLAGEWLLNLQHSVERMLDEEFLNFFNEVLYGEPHIERRRHFDPETYSADAALLQTWKVREIFWPSWIPEDGRYEMLAPFPVPIVHWRALDEAPAEKDGPARSRGPLQHFQMRWHPQYLLICSACDWPQGPRGGAEIFNSKAPNLREQLDQIGKVALGGSQAQDPRFVDLWLSIEYELWGRFAFHLSPGNKNSEDMTQDKNRLHYLLDQALGFAGVSGIETVERETNERLEIVAWILGQLRCRICPAVGSIRYLPQIQFPIEFQRKPSAQAKRLVSLAFKLRSTRPADLADVRYKVFWFPEEPPRQRVELLAKRMANALTRAGRQPPLLLIADWLIPIARRSEKYWIDRVETDVLEQVPEEEREDVSNALGRLRQGLVGPPRSKRISVNTERLRLVFREPRYAFLIPLLLDHYRHKELGERLSDRKYKSSRRTKPSQ